jgi:ABC transporter transmembrane region
MNVECLGIGGAVMLIAYGQVSCWLMTSHRQTFRIRAALLRAVLRQEVGWFDTHDSGGISNRLSEYVLIFVFVRLLQTGHFH